MLNDEFLSRLQTAVLSLQATSKKVTTIPDEAGQYYDDIRPVVEYWTEVDIESAAHALVYSSSPNAWRVQDLSNLRPR